MREDDTEVGTESPLDATQSDSSKSINVVVIGELLMLLSSLSCGILIKDDTAIQVDIPNRENLIAGSFRLVLGVMAATSAVQDSLLMDTIILLVRLRALQVGQAVV